MGAGFTQVLRPRNSALCIFCQNKGNDGNDATARYSREGARLLYVGRPRSPGRPEEKFKTYSLPKESPDCRTLCVPAYSAPVARISSTTRQGEMKGTSALILL